MMQFPLLSARIFLNRYKEKLLPERTTNHQTKPKKSTSYQGKSTAVNVVTVWVETKKCPAEAKPLM
jgi:hypothetical protein